MAYSDESAWQLVAIDDLPSETQMDIVHWLAETHSEHGDWEHFKANLLGLVAPPMVWVGRMRVDELHTGMRRDTSAAAVSKYRGQLQGAPTFEFDPILVSKGAFLDGGHRMRAYHEAGREWIPVVEVRHLVEVSPELWQQWFDGVDVAFDPGSAPDGSAARKPALSL